MLLTFHCDPICLSCLDELKLFNDCASFFLPFLSLSIILLVLFTTKNIYFSCILFEIQTCLSGAFSMLFSI